MNGKVLRKKKNVLLLQQRDMDILKNVYYFRFLESGQVRELCSFSSQKRANDRLRKLFDGGFLSRRLLVSGFEKRLLYFIGPKTVELIASRAGLDASEIRNKRMKALKARDSFLFKFLRVNDFRFALEMSLRKDSLMKTEIFKYKPVLFLDEEKKLLPDAYFRLKCREKVRSFFLEEDQSVESRKRIERKVENYLDYGLSGSFERHFGFRYFRLLIICKSTARLKSLVKMIEKVTDKSFFWLASESDISPENILSEIWLRPNKEGSFSLLK